MHKAPVALLVLLSAVVAAALAATSGSGATLQTSPACSSTDLATWSPIGAQIAFVGRRLHHGALPPRAICVANADGKQATPLQHTVCTRKCPHDLIEDSTQLVWVQLNLILYGDDFRIFRIPVGGEPQLIGKQFGSLEHFSVDSAADRVAAGGPASCVRCAGPVTVLDVSSGALVGRIGGKKLRNISPSISPDGKQVVFLRYHRGDDARGLGIWTASANGSHLRRLLPAGGLPLWSTDGKKIAYLGGKAPAGLWSALRVVSPQGGKSTTLVPKGVIWVFGWSPDAKSIAFEAHGRLEVVDVATHNVRSLLKLHFGPSVAWSADSQQLLVRTQPKRDNRCASLWRVPAGGGKPQLLRSC
jgi:hypothetical protein